MVTSLLHWSKVIIQTSKDGDGKRTFELGMILTMFCHQWDSNAKLKQNQPNRPQQDCPVTSLPCEKAPRRPTSGMSGAKWSDDLLHSKQPKSHLIATFNSSELTIPPFVEPSQTNEPPIPGPSPSSKPYEEVTTHEP
ncbi:hypothetical protein O181_010713 [Austropuccinia psidii MF-1]|uniref:Uncharacterized protein n=1 Tax=Austropuccinia psidii MF-1 TaxID=1389203 RepID=A0A9Q3BTV9_9BASI|nr:hypothetical protein [Austropuccinia psidii MF-1]